MSKITEDALLVNSKEGMKYSNNFMTEWCKSRLLDYNKNIIGVCIGDPGSGKSWSMIRMGELIDPDFNIDQIVFSPLEFIKLINTGKLKKGSVIVFEEIQTSMSRREWFSITNKMMNYVLSTFRNLNLGLLFTTPDLSYVDSNSVKLLKLVFETMGIDKDKDMSIIRPKIISTNHTTGKVYQKYLRVIIDGEVRVMDSLYLKKANKKLLAEYELKKAKFNELLNRRVEKELNKIEDDANPSNTKLLTEQEQNVFDLLAEGYNNEQIAESLNLNQNRVRYLLFRIKQKGVKIG